MYTKYHTFKASIFLFTSHGTHVCDRFSERKHLGNNLSCLGTCWRNIVLRRASPSRDRFVLSPIGWHKAYCPHTSILTRSKICIFRKSLSSVNKRLLQKFTGNLVAMPFNRHFSYFINKWASTPRVHHCWTQVLFISPQKLQKMSPTVLPKFVFTKPPPVSMFVSLLSFISSLRRTSQLPTLIIDNVTMVIQK